MLKRVTSLATSGALAIATAVALLPASAHAAPETYTGHVQVIVGDTIVGCAAEDSRYPYAGYTTDPSLAYDVTIGEGAHQELVLGNDPTQRLGSFSPYMQQGVSSSYTFLRPVAPGGGDQTALWTIDPATRVLSATWTWPDTSTKRLHSWSYDTGGTGGTRYVGLAVNVADFSRAHSGPRGVAATFRIGSTCSGPVVPDVSQAITFTSTAPTTAHPGQTYTVAATGGASGNAVTFSSATEENCTVNGTTVTFGKPGTCTITADQAAAPGYAAAPKATQDITVSAIATSVELTLDPESKFDGQTSTATADITVSTGSATAAGGVVQFAVGGTLVGFATIDARGRAIFSGLVVPIGTYNVTATYIPSNPSYAGSTDTATLTVKAPASQEITFTSSAPTPAHPGQTYDVEATGGASANPVIFSSATAEVCDVDDATVTFTKPGTCTIRANQAGSTGHTAAPTASQDITVSAIPSAVKLTLDPTSMFDGQVATATADVTVTTGSLTAAGGTVQFAVDGDAVGAPVAIDADGRAASSEIERAVGMHDVTATYTPANANYVGSTDTATLTVKAKSPQEITFTSSAPKPGYPTDSYEVEAIGGGSGKPVTFSSATEEVCDVDDATVIFTKPGTCTIEANQAGGVGHFAAPTATQDITVSAIPSAVELTLHPKSMFDGEASTATADVSVTAGSLTAAGGTVQFAVDGDDVGSPVAIDADGRATSPALARTVGSFDVTATYAPANANYTGSTDTATLTVTARTPQRIIFVSSPPRPAHPGQIHRVAATGGSSTKPVTYSSATPDVCEITGDSVTFTMPGTCTIEANQAGTAGYSAAPTVMQDVTVTAIPTAVALSLDATTVFDGQNASATAVVTATSGSVKAAAGSIQFAVDGTKVGSPVAVGADGRAVSPDLGGAVGSHDVTAAYVPANTNYTGSTDTATLTVKAKATQEIRFTSPAPKPAHPGMTYTVAATGGESGKPVTFFSTTEKVCEIDGASVTFTTPGTCTIEANQAGATGHAAAPTATQDVTVSAIPSAVALSLDLDTVFNGQVATATADVTVTSGSLEAAGGSVQFAVDGDAVGSPRIIDADGRATSPELEGAVGTHDVTATYVPANSNYAGSRGTTPLTVTAKAPQAITFTSSAPSPAYPGRTYPVAAVGGASGQPVKLVSTTADHCTTDGTTVTFGKPGTCTIEATQAGTTGFSAAPAVSQRVTVSAIPSTVAVKLGLPSVVTGQRTTATADVTVPAGSISAAGGTVQFAVDGTKVGSPVAVRAGGRAVSPELGGTVGTHRVTATYVPTDGTRYAGSSTTAALIVVAAGTTTKVSVSASALTATVAPIAPGAGTPTGEVTFHVDGKKVGAATLKDGSAKLTHAVPTDTTHAVSAEYTGDAGFTASSASTSRSNPSITAKVSSAQKSRNGWFRTPVTVSFTCDAKGAELVTACPKPVTVSKQGASSVTRTVRTADGGIATATAGVKVDSTKPRVSLKGVKAGRRYFDAPKPRCTVKDTGSGAQTCKVTTQRRGSRVVVTAKATDAAGNVSTKRVSYRLASFTIRGAKKVGNTYRVKHGRTYTLQVRGTKARYVYATPAPGRPHRGSVPFKKAGRNTWTLGVTMSMTTRGTRSWNLGYTQNGKLHIVKVKVTG
ncbi:hypothetical protein AFL01nite_26120 [Aeromicrobium flavum]|uniref:Bacterial Ig-like domain-containing protein n=1 Tax=Aeromicrobium flavum TaxID=416568 RepID=A0A512HXV8_9ACTN|nr:Ig-like domain repeat protein [Aeromicrobium flavum]GEO90285.1 hypothetical protein AFL01nite_26120 [Aeromicrobium flavum]